MKTGKTLPWVIWVPKLRKVSKIYKVLTYGNFDLIYYLTLADCGSPSKFKNY